MSKTILSINKAMIRPVMIMGVEKNLVFLNALLSFPLVAATHFKMPDCLIGLLFYVLMHFIFRMISQHDSQLMKLLKRCTRYQFRSYFPAHSHPSMTMIWKIKTLP